jgi:hypothetical protein
MGGGGKVHKLSKKEVERIAKRCKNRGSFQAEDRKAYDSARNNGWLEDVCQYMSFCKGALTKGGCCLKTFRCNTRDEFRSKYPREARRAQVLGCYQDITRHMPAYKKKILCENNGKTYESIRQATEELRLNSANISAVINGRRTHTKNFRFRLI